MQRGQRGIVASSLGSAIGLMLVAALGGCVADSGDGAIFVLKNVMADEECKVTATESEAGIPHGRLDLLLPSSYVFIAQMKSRITALVGQEAQRTIILSGAKVDLAFPDSTLFSDAELAELKASGLTHFKQLFSAPLTPNGGILDAGFNLIPSELIDRVIAKADLTRTFRIEAVATFTVEGKMSGQDVSSQQFTFPVTLGNNVSVNIAGSCGALPTGFMARTGYACNPAQDGIIDCCRAPGSLALVCPAVATAAR